MDNKDNKRILIIAGLFTVATFAIILGINSILKMDKSVPKVNSGDIDIASSVVARDTPEETSIAFIYLNGNMGDMAIEATKENVKSGSAMSLNRHRRSAAQTNAYSGLIPGSPLFSPSQDDWVREYSEGLDAIIFYEVEQDSIKVSKPRDERLIQVASDIGLHEYTAVDIYASFTSKKIHYERARDSTWDGTYAIVENSQKVDDLKITLVEVDGKWMVYDVPEAEELLNSRFGTWRGIEPETIDVSRNKEIGKININE